MPNPEIYEIDVNSLGSKAKNAWIVRAQKHLLKKEKAERCQLGEKF